MSQALVLRLAGPLQSWGDSSRFAHRGTRQEPTKSGILGLIAAAQGRRRVDPIEDLVRLGYGVRVDQPGRLIRDFQTAKRHDSGKALPLSYRYYLGDAVFVAAIAGDRALLEGVAEAIASPAFPLYLGRRSCPPSLPLVLGIRDGDPRSVLRDEPWHASAWHMHRTRSERVTLEIFRDALGPDEIGETVRDVPLSFSQERREYGWRTVVREQGDRPNPEYRPGSRDPDDAPEHDALAALGGV